MISPVVKTIRVCARRGCERVRALVASGADRTVIPIEVARRVGARLGEPAVARYNGRFCGRRARVEIDLGGDCRAPVDVVAYRCAIMGRMSPELPGVVIGADTLKAAGAVLEFAPGSMTLRCRRRRQRRGHAGS